jgi:hypothetical protein
MLTWGTVIGLAPLLLLQQINQLPEHVNQMALVCRGAAMLIRVCVKDKFLEEWTQHVHGHGHSLRKYTTVHELFAKCITRSISSGDKLGRHACLQATCDVFPQPGLL